MRTSPSSRAMPVCGDIDARSPRTVSVAVRISTLPNASTRSSLPAPGGSLAPAAAAALAGGRRRRGGAGRLGNRRPACRRRAACRPWSSPRRAAADRHALLRPVFQAVPGGDHLLRGGQRQVAPGQHQHRLVDVVDRAVAAGGVGRGGRSSHGPRLPAARSRCCRSGAGIAAAPPRGRGAGRGGLPRAGAGCAGAPALLR